MHRIGIILALLVLWVVPAVAQPCPPVGGSPCTTNWVVLGTLTLTGATVAGAPTWGSSQTFPGITATGTAAIGTGSANSWLCEGSSGSPDCHVVGSGNQFAVLKGLGNFGGLFQSSHGNVLLTDDTGATIGNFLTLQANVAGSAIGLSASDNNGGIQSNSPFLVQYNWTYGGSATGSSINHPFQIISNIAGTSANTAEYALNFVQMNLNYSSGQGAIGFDISTNLQTGFYGSSTPFLSTMSQSAAPTVPSAWVGTTAYSPAGKLVFNGANEYQLNSASCTSGSSGGPTGGGTSISDGTCNWRFVTNIAQAYYLNAAASQGQASFNAGGSASASAGFVFGGNAVGSLSSSATYYSELIGYETDSFNTLVSGNPFRQAIHQFVKTGNGASQDWGLSIAGKSYNAAVFQTAVMPNGVGIEFADQNVGGLQTMAGAFDCILCSTTGTNTTSGYFVTGGGGYIVRGPGAQLLGTGDLQIGSAGFHITSQALTIDTTYQVLASVGAVSGGTNWTTGMIAVDDFGNAATVTASAGVPSSISIAAMPRTYVIAASVPGGAVTWHPAAANGNILDTAGGATLATNFTTASETYTAGTTLNFGTASATAINIGNASANVLLGPGSALATNATVGFPLIPSSAGTPTGTVAGAAAGKVAIQIDTTNKKLCYSIGGGTWECSVAFLP